MFPSGAMPSDGVRRRPRSIPRLDGAVQDRREIPRHQLPVHGRLRRQRLLLGGDGHTARHIKGKRRHHVVVSVTPWFVMRFIGKENISILLIEIGNFFTFSLFGKLIVQLSELLQLPSSRFVFRSGLPSCEETTSRGRSRRSTASMTSV